MSITHSLPVQKTDFTSDCPNPRDLLAKYVNAIATPRPGESSIGLMSIATADLLRAIADFEREESSSFVRKMTTRSDKITRQ